MNRTATLFAFLLCTASSLIGWTVSPVFAATTITVTANKDS
jgi:hypothetical protein